MGSYILAYIFGTYMTMYASANLSSFVGSISPMLSIIFWFSLPSVNNWAGGAAYQPIDIICNTIALLPIFGGIYFFRKNEQEDKQPDINEGNVEICC